MYLTVAGFVAREQDRVVPDPGFDNHERCPSAYKVLAAEVWALDR
jgi:hypothetical protein